jgi:hypothetical protein
MHPVEQLIRPGLVTLIAGPRNAGKNLVTCAAAALVSRSEREVLWLSGRAMILSCLDAAVVEMKAALIVVDAIDIRSAPGVLPWLDELAARREMAILVAAHLPETGAMAALMSLSEGERNTFVINVLGDGRRVLASIHGGEGFIFRIGARDIPAHGTERINESSHCPCLPKIWRATELGPCTRRSSPPQRKTSIEKVIHAKIHPKPLTDCTSPTRQPLASRTCEGVGARGAFVRITAGCSIPGWWRKPVPARIPSLGLNLVKNRRPFPVARRPDCSATVRHLRIASARGGGNQNDCAALTR